MVPVLALLVLWLLFIQSRLNDRPSVIVRMFSKSDHIDLSNLLPDLAGVLALLFGLLLLFAFAWDGRELQVSVLMFVALLLPRTWVELVPESMAAWATATLAIWPLLVLLSCQVSWFGYGGVP